MSDENRKMYIDDFQRISAFFFMKSLVVISTCLFRMTSKKDLAKMMKISRPTLDKWIRDGFIQPHRLARSLEIFPVGAVLEQLEKQRKKK